MKFKIYNNGKLLINEISSFNDRNIHFIFHGLFGRAKNWHSIALKLSCIVEGLFIVFDLRNHGENEPSTEISYSIMVNDVYEFIIKKNINLLNSKNFFEPYVEPEISFRIKDDINISKAPFKFKDLDYLLDGLFCSVEIVDFRFRKPLSEIGALNVISTNGASEFWIRDENLIKIKDVDLNNFEVSLLINDTIVDTGNTKNVLDNPLNAVLWLINNLAEKGEPMLKGQFISSGSCTKAFRIYPKSKIKADFNQLGSIEFEYI